jgi:hypothetical protein
MMRQLGIFMAAFDFIETPSGEYVFLEVNEGGQFLWAEDELEDIPLLDALVEFLLSKDPGHVYSARKPLHSFRSFLKSQFYQDFANDWRANHCPVDTTFISPDSLSSTHEPSRAPR